MTPSDNCGCDNRTTSEQSFRLQQKQLPYIQLQLQFVNLATGLVEMLQLLLETQGNDDL